jgi:hypothetical protein
MKAKHLKPGTRFTVDPPDPESPVRVCLTNDDIKGLRFGWPNNAAYCYMGGAVEVGSLTQRTAQSSSVSQATASCSGPKDRHPVIVMQKGGE